MAKNNDSRQEPITEDKAQRILELMLKINEVNAKVHSDYMAAIDFLELKGLKKDFEEFLISRRGVN